MNLTEKLLPVALLGAEWVLWLLVLLSIISVTIMIERLWYFRSTEFNVEGLIRDPRRRAELGHGAQRRARQRFSAEVIVPQYEELYRRVCASKPLGHT